MNRHAGNWLHRGSFVASIVLIALLGIYPTGCRTSDNYREKALSAHEFRQLLMGVQARIIVFSDEEPRARAAARAAFAEISRLNAIMSDYDDSSEIMRLVQQQAGTAHPISEDLARVLHAGQTLSQRSDGKFDITVGPIVRLWRQARRNQQLPDPDDLADARRRSGWRLLAVQGNSARLARDGMQLDLGGIAKGYAAQRAVELLREHGFSRCMVALAGDVVVGDPPPGEEAWTVQIRTGQAFSEPRMLHLANRAVSTSGDTEQFVDIDGVRYSHIVDPHTGLGLSNRTAATVIAMDGMTADSLASAICVLGIDDAEALVSRYDGCVAMIEQIAESGLRRGVVDPLGLLESFWFGGEEIP